MSFTTFQLKLQLCPVCGYTLDGATNVERPVPPSPEDVTVCIECASVLQFGADLKLSKVDIETLPSDIQATLREIIWAVGEVKKVKR